MATYQHSGTVSLKGLAFGLIAGVGTALVLSIPYAYITVYIPFLYANIIATAAFGVITGNMIGFGARKGMLQSAFACSLVGAIVGLAAEYFNWVFWIFALSRQKMLVLQPAGIIEVARHILPEGTWGLGHSGQATTGIPLLIVWIGEAVLIIGCVIVLARDGIAKHFCCVNCQAWFNQPTKTLSFEVPADSGNVADAMKRQDFTVIATMKPIDRATSDRFMGLNIYLCPKCMSFGCFSLETVQIFRKGNKVESKSEVLIRNEMLTPGVKF